MEWTHSYWSSYKSRRWHSTNANYLDKDLPDICSTRTTKGSVAEGEVCVGAMCEESEDYDRPEDQM